MIGEVAVLAAFAVTLAERAPGLELAHEGAVHCADVADGEPRERLARGGAALAVDADDLDLRPASPARHRRRGHVGLIGGDRELLVLRILVGLCEPFRESRRVLPGSDVPAGGLRIPQRPQCLDLGLLLGGDVEIESVRAHACGHGFESGCLTPPSPRVPSPYRPACCGLPWGSSPG